MSNIFSNKSFQNYCPAFCSVLSLWLQISKQCKKNLETLFSKVLTWSVLKWFSKVIILLENPTSRCPLFLGPQIVKTAGTKIADDEDAFNLLFSFVLFLAQILHNRWIPLEILLPLSLRQKSRLIFLFSFPIPTMVKNHNKQWMLNWTKQ